MAAHGIVSIQWVGRSFCITTSTRKGKLLSLNVSRSKNISCAGNGGPLRAISRSEWVLQGLCCALPRTLEPKAMAWRPGALLRSTCCTVINSSTESAKVGILTAYSRIYRLVAPKCWQAVGGHAVQTQEYLQTPELLYQGRKRAMWCCVTL
jgi:hypothetical protein